MQEPTTALSTAQPQVQTFALISEAANNPDFDAAKFETLVKLHREECERQERQEAYRSLAAFKAACPMIKKTRGVNDNSGNRRYNYAPLDDLMRQIGPLMREHNLSATYSHDVVDCQHFTTCRLLHGNGYLFPESKVQINRAQGNRMTSECQVSGITQSYGERYALKAALGLVFSDEDTDGEMPEEKNTPDPNLDSAITALLQRFGMIDSDLDAALTEKGIDLNGWTWREQDEKVKSRIVSGWGKLFPKVCEQ